MTNGNAVADEAPVPLAAPDAVSEDFAAFEDIGMNWSAFLVLTCAERNALHKKVGSSEADREKLEQAIAKDYRKLTVKRPDWDAKIRDVIGEDNVESDGEVASAGPTTSSSTAARQDPVVGTVVDTSKAKEFVGLQNQASTCYLNAFIQSFFHLPYFRQTIYDMTVSEGTKPEDSVPYALQRLFCQMQSRQEHVKTVELTSAFGWTSEDAAVQHDIHELCAKLLENLEDQMKGTALDGRIKDMFEGKHVYYTRCLDADYTSRREQAFTSVELVVKDNSSMVESLRSYIKPERLDGKIYKWEHDDGTETLHEAERGVSFRKLPPILMIHPNRVDFCMKTFQRVTVANEWDFPMELDFTEFIDTDTDPANRRQTSTASASEGRQSSIRVDAEGDLKYSLHSIIIHSGGATYGHYYCYVRYGDQWLKFNDETVTVESEATVIADSIGGETTTRNHWGELRSYPKTKRAAYFTYISKPLVEKLVFPITELPPHLEAAIDELKAQKAAEKAEKEADLLRVGITTIVQDPAGEYLNAMNDKTLRKKIKFDRNDTVDDMKEKIASECGLEASSLRLWQYHTHFASSYYRDNASARLIDGNAAFTARDMDTNIIRPGASYSTYNYWTTLFVQVADPSQEDLMERVNSTTSNKSQTSDRLGDIRVDDSDADSDTPRPTLLHVSMHVNDRLMFFGVYDSLSTATTAVALEAGIPSPDEFSEKWVVRTYNEKTLSDPLDPEDIRSGDHLVFAAKEVTSRMIERDHEMRHSAMNIALYPLEGDHSEAMLSLDLGPSMSLKEVQSAVYEGLVKLNEAEPEKLKGFMLPESAEYIGLRNHDANADLPNRKILHTSKYHQWPTYRKNEIYDHKLETMIATHGYMLERLYFQALPCPMSDIDEDLYTEFIWSLTDRGTPLFLRTDDRPSWAALIERAKETKGLAPDIDVRVIRLDTYRDSFVEYTKEDDRLVAHFDTYSVYAFDQLATPTDGVAEADQEMWNARHVTRTAGEDFYGYPFTVYYQSATDTGESLMKRILAAADVPEDTWDNCLKNWRLLVHDGYTTRKLIDVKAKVADVVKEADADNDKGYFMLDHPVVGQTARRSRGAERELKIKAKPSTPTPE